MACRLEILKGTWYKHLYANVSDTTTTVHVEKNVKFLDSAPKRIKLIGKKLRIGRNHVNEIVLDDKSVSRFHCELECNGIGPFASWTIRDCGSSTGTGIKRGKKFIRKGKDPSTGENDNTPFKLKSGDHLQLAETEILVRIGLF